VTTALALGLVHLCTPGPQTGWPYQVQDLLDERDTACTRQAAAYPGTADWFDARMDLASAEARLARLLNVPPPEPAPLDCEPWFAWPTT
jgi:hypothetical protein